MSHPRQPITQTEFHFQGSTFIADPSGALFWPAEHLMAVADLHFEKGSSFAERGVFLPPYDTDATLKRLEAAVTKYQPSHVLSLGDTFHDPEGEARLSSANSMRIRRLTQARRWTWLTGNHDPAPPTRVGGEPETELKIGNLTFTHEPDCRTGLVAGHLHPCASVRSMGRRIRRRCFAHNQDRLILPSFGAFTGGLCVLDPAFAPFLPGPFKAILLGDRAYTFQHTKLVPDVAA